MRELTAREASELLRSLEGVSEKDHFGGDGFSANGRMFATVWHERGEVNLRLSPDEQREFLGRDGDGFAEIANAWGRQGWTKVQLEFLDARSFGEAANAAWRYSAQKTVPLKSAAEPGARKRPKPSPRARPKSAAKSRSRKLR